MAETMVIYDEERWGLFNLLRRRSLEMIKPLHQSHVKAVAYGSIARGDVRQGSDIDVFIPVPPAPTLLEAAILREGLQPTRREIVQATPNYAVKGYIYIDRHHSYSFPLVKLRAVEKEFYNFAGCVDYNDIENGARRPGVDKRLKLIEPTTVGHKESSIRGRMGIVAKILGVEVDIVLQRLAILEKRRKVGRTGVYLKRELAPIESFGEVLHNLARDRPGLRRRMR